MSGFKGKGLQKLFPQGIIYLVLTQNFPKNCHLLQGVRDDNFSENFVYVLNGLSSGKQIWNKKLAVNPNDHSHSLSLGNNCKADWAQLQNSSILYLKLRVGGFTKACVRYFLSIFYFFTK